jgi:hypothetical protein
MASKGLPGFLRRSVRRDFDEEDEEERLSASNSSLNSGKPLHAVIPEQAAGNEVLVDMDVANGDSENDEPPTPAPTPYSATDGSSVSSLEASSPEELADPQPLPTPTDRKYSYRENQFKKIISADVVNMTELRKIAWNGIPVRSVI